jgi:hypothetical protein
LELSSAIWDGIARGAEAMSQKIKAAFDLSG